MGIDKCLDIANKALSYEEIIETPIEKDAYRMDDKKQTGRSRFNSTRPKQNEQNVALVANNVPKTITCVICAGNHYNNKCTNPNNMSGGDIKNILLSKNCCLRCLNPGHAADLCGRRAFCYLCKSGGHHKLVCSTGSRRAENSGSSDSRPRNNLTIDNGSMEDEEY